MELMLFMQLVGTFIVAAIGWWAGHYLTARRDHINERRKLRTAYLLEAYRRLESVANRKNMSREQYQAFESAIADIQLLGKLEHVEVVKKFCEQYTSNQSASVDDILRVLRKDLRQEMRLSGDINGVVMFRFLDHR